MARKSSVTGRSIRRSRSATNMTDPRRMPTRTSDCPW
jgi:hypothetical protein